MNAVRILQIAVLGALLGLVVPPTALARHDATSPEGLEVAEAKLASPGLYGTGAVWDGSRYVYIFGGSNGTGSEGFSDAILRYDESTGILKVMKARLPTGREGASAAWVDRYAYVFGGSWLEMDFSESDGHGYPVYTDEIVRYDPRADAVKVMGAKLPTPRWATSATTDGNHVYLFGGHDGQDLDEILRYDPADDTVTRVEGRMGGLLAGAAWADGFAYVWSGHYPSRYDPRTGQALYQMGMDPCTECRARDGRTSVVSDGSNLYLFGGRWGPYPTDQILRFNLRTNDLAILNTTLPPRSADGGSLPGRMSTSAVWVGTHALIFGGETRGGGTPVSNEILRFHPGQEPSSTSPAVVVDEPVKDGEGNPVSGPGAAAFLIAAGVVWGRRRRGRF